MSTIEDNELPVVKVNVIERGGAPRKGWVNCQIGANLQFSADSLAS
jgi:hypothetical protein